MVGMYRSASESHLSDERLKLSFQRLGCHITKNSELYLRASPSIQQTVPSIHPFRIHNVSELHNVLEKGLYVAANGITLAVDFLDVALSQSMSFYIKYKIRFGPYLSSYHVSLKLLL